MSNDLRSWFVTFPNGIIPLVENWGLTQRSSVQAGTLLFCPYSLTQRSSVQAGTLLFCPYSLTQRSSVQAGTLRISCDS
ncbi:hypothetical protein E3N88_46326 [Mikania micrantha]|uniref:Uncharacterized protein n=1 Tax=Mikania micrantha TaxID=192012 RepID=A0A5N6L6L3_9ASTR|nr:hypothetical protein E3N88_46326 [Mikania micrantha]